VNSGTDGRWEFQYPGHSVKRRGELPLLHRKSENTRQSVPRTKGKEHVFGVAKKRKSKRSNKKSINQKGGVIRSTREKQAAERRGEGKKKERQKVEWGDMNIRFLPKVQKDRKTRKGAKMGFRKPPRFRNGRNRQVSASGDDKRASWERA